MEYNDAYGPTRRDEKRPTDADGKYEGYHEFVDLVNRISNKTITPHDRCFDVHGPSDFFLHLQLFVNYLGYNKKDMDAWCAVGSSSEFTHVHVCEEFMSIMSENGTRFSPSDVDHTTEHYVGTDAVRDIYKIHVGNSTGHYVITIFNFPAIKKIRLKIRASVADDTRGEIWRNKPPGSLFPSIFAGMSNIRHEPSSEHVPPLMETNTVAQQPETTPVPELWKESELWKEYVDETWVNDLVSSLPRPTQETTELMNRYLLEPHGFNARNLLYKNEASAKPHALTKLVFIEYLMLKLCKQQCQDTRMLPPNTQAMIVVAHRLEDEDPDKDVEHFLRPRRQFLVNDPLALNRAFRKLTTDVSLGWPKASAQNQNTTMVTTLLAGLGFVQEEQGPWSHKMAGRGPPNTDPSEKKWDPVKRRWEPVYPYGMRDSLYFTRYIWNADKMLIKANQRDIWKNVG